MNHSFQVTVRQNHRDGNNEDDNGKDEDNAAKDDSQTNRCSCTVLWSFSSWQQNHGIPNKDQNSSKVAMKRGNYWHGNTAPISSQICCSEQRGDPSWAWSIIRDSIVLALEPWPSCSVSITDPSCDLGKQVKVTVNKWSSIKSLKLVWTSETTLNLLSCKVWKI